MLGRWASWGAIPNVFADDPGDWATTAAQLRELVTATEWAAARRTTINAHYTGPTLVAPVWRFLTRVGLDGGTVLEPGCGSGNFIGFAPAVLDEALSWIGIELDPITAQIAQHLYPDAEIRNEGFETTTMPDASVDLVVGNVPFGQVALNDPIHNPTHESIHNHFILKGLRLLRPGGYLAVITSRYALDARNPTARHMIGRSRRSRVRRPLPILRTSRGGWHLRGHRPADPAAPTRRCAGRTCRGVGRHRHDRHRRWAGRRERVPRRTGPN